MFNLFKKGRKRDLDENDLYTTLSDQTASPLGDELEKSVKQFINVTPLIIIFRKIYLVLTDQLISILGYGKVN